MMSIVTKCDNNKDVADEAIVEHQLLTRHTTMQKLYLFYIIKNESKCKNTCSSTIMQCQFKQVTVTVSEMVNKKQIWKI